MLERGSCVLDVLAELLGDPLHGAAVERAREMLEDELFVRTPVEAVPEL
jgi:hypothetical protein